MRYLIFCFFASIGSLAAQERPLLIYQTTINAFLPFYEIQDIACYTNRRWNPVSMQQYNAYTSSLALTPRGHFSVLDGEIDSDTKANEALKELFDIDVYQKHPATRTRQATFEVVLIEKDLDTQQEIFQKRFEEHLQAQHPTYKLSVTIEQKKKMGRLMFSIKVFSNTGGDEFETSQAIKERVEHMKKEAQRMITRQLFLYTSRVQKLQREVIEPYRAALRAQHDPKKLSVVTLNMQTIGRYSADKQQFADVIFENGAKMSRLNISAQQARVLRDSPQDYQLKAYVFEGRKSSPWCPNHDVLAFGHYEVVHEETQALLARVRGYFELPSTKAYYRYTLYFPSF